ncbi:HAD family acid phosphatase [Streptomyces rubrolavendulae]|uniref:HAD superfamily, subfamily IIIB (Acid phosphatase) n=1 Tax=Streptomyces rubrolavendulae TaxID=285473 RepID=A0A1D8G8J4_9ACTN|nr:HAD family acid phosphatase [Streptomyces rubrolavendulae]AOT61777.1 HAD superfamily, subfamily IIIB (Acid phosphatase) [Streptomyces rubrolavendulae]
MPAGTALPGRKPALPGRTARRRALTVAATAALALAWPVQAQAAAPAEAPARPAAAVAATGGIAHLKGVDYTAWQRDVAAALASARPYIEQRTANASGEKLAIVLDIDNTSLETDFHYFWEYPTPAVRPALDLARYADTRGVDVFFVTARPGIIHDLTARNLRSVGYPVDGLYVRDLPDLFAEVSAYKTEKRTEIEAKGYKIIANIGNRPSDLAGGHAERTFKLPDYDGKLS